MHRFIVPSTAGESDRILLDAKESHHARNVLRVKLGEAVEVLDGKGAKFRAVVAGFEETRVILSVDRQTHQDVPGIQVTLAVAVIKPERMEWMLEKCCELGVREWIPVLTERSVIKLSRERWQAKLGRWRKIAAESCKQSGQARVPDLREPTPFNDMLKEAGHYDGAWIPTLAAPGPDLRKALAAKPKAARALFLIGPEGDFTEKEAKKAVLAGILPVSLGASILRAETAALYTLSAAHFFYGSSAVSESKDK